jgi:hypothetical protein
LQTLQGFFIAQIPPKLEKCYNDDKAPKSPYLKVVLMAAPFGRYTALVLALAGLAACIVKVVQEFEKLAGG